MAVHRLGEGDVGAGPPVHVVVIEGCGAKATSGRLDDGGDLGPGQWLVEPTGGTGGSDRLPASRASPGSAHHDPGRGRRSEVLDQGDQARRRRIE